MFNANFTRYSYTRVHTILSFRFSVTVSSKSIESAIVSLTKVRCTYFLRNNKPVYYQNVEIVWIVEVVGHYDRMLINVLGAQLDVSSASRSQQ